MSGDAKSAMADEVRAWAEKNPEEAPPPPPPNAPGSTATPTPSSPPPQTPPPAAQAAAVDDDEDDDDEPALAPEEAAAMFIGLLDVALTNFVSDRLAFKPKQEAKLVRLATPLAKKYLPDVEGIVSPETAFVGALGLICWKNYTSSPETGSSPASPPGVNESATGNSGGHTTEASVDGRPVNAEVLQ